MSTTPQIYDRFDAARNYERHLFRADRVLQSAELNEIQRSVHYRLQGLADALFKDGDIVRDARIVVDAETGATRCESGALYLAGAVRGVPPADLVVPTVGLVTVGVYLREHVVTELEDPALRNPAAGTRGYQEPGAARLQVLPEWGLAGGAGAFYPVYVVEDGQVRAKEPPPQLDAVTQALARYDRDSAGGGYVVSGLQVTMAPDLPTGQQVYTVSEGRARVSGYGIELPTSRRLVYAADPDLQFIDSEPHASITAAAQRITLDRAPVARIASVHITMEVTRQLTHGSFAGAMDPLPDNAVLQLLEVSQGNTVYTKDADWKLTGGQVDWSPNGAEPAPGSTYSARYQYITTVQPTAVDATGCTVTGAVPGSLVLVSYHQMLPRVDRLCLDPDGAFVWLRGVASAWRPAAPTVPAGLLPIASVQQTWTSTRSVASNGVRVVSMSDLAALTARMDQVVDLIAQQRLQADAGLREAGAKKGLLVDPFLGDSMRDQGLPQTAAVVDGELVLPITSAQALALPTAPQVPALLPFELIPVLQQLLRTGSMLVNPYMAFEPLPAAVKLTPAVDQWSDIQTIWLSSLTRVVSAGPTIYTTDTSQWGNHTLSRETDNVLVSSVQRPLENLRQIEVQFEVAGFGPHEQIRSMSFDGLDVLDHAGAALVADEAGRVRGSFTIPPNVQTGAKRFSITGAAGSHGEATFTGSGFSRVETHQLVTTVVNQYIDPLAQTFTLDASTQVAAVDLWFTAKGGSRVLVQIRETQLGFPTRTVLAEAQIAPDQVLVDGRPTRISFTSPVALEGRAEYALVVLCDDATTSVAISELGKFDAIAQQYATTQAYNVGVLLSSANASTWTAHQTLDLAFRLHAAAFSADQRVLELGELDVQDATDLLLLSVVETPVAAARVDYTLALPDGSHVTVADGQPLRLASPVTGKVSVAARLAGTAQSSPVLHPSAQLVAATVGTQADYISRAVAAGGVSRVRVIYEAQIPGGAGVLVAVADAALDATQAAAWAPAANTAATPLGNGWLEMAHELQDLHADSLRVRLRLSGSTAARPRVRNLRVIVL
ncbi:MAG: DUF4815 domain-containing protein [Roseateles depolymerans]|uniref:DUF4815 domain-containing protein n=1 Tax=Roseateles depolymerans TaxID=76731 RepID=A0A2W5DL44_9BURK|nr:MAG: DUF4815 domain-containing protein [Roseateles depolymerans]